MVADRNKLGGNQTRAEEVQTGGRNEANETTARTPNPAGTESAESRAGTESESGRRGPSTGARTKGERTADLVAAAQRGDPDAFEQLVLATQDDVYTLALRLCGNPEDARDVAQEAFIRAYRSLGSFRGEAAFSTWMYRITANAASSHMSRRFKRKTEPLAEGFEPSDDRPESSPSAVAEFGDLRERVDAAVANLAPKLRAVVVLRDGYDLSHEEIAAELGISVSAAKVRLHRARAQLKSQLFSPVGGEAREL